MTNAAMSEPATLEPVVYDKVFNDAGQLVGYQVPKHERRRWNSGSRYPGTGSLPVYPVEPEQQPARELEEIVAELDAWAIGDDNLYGQLGALYETKPLIADRIAAAAVSGAQSGSLHSPTAYLASRLRPRK